MKQHKHTHTFRDHHFIVWNGKVVKFCDDPACLHYKEKDDERYIYNAQLNESRINNKRASL